MSLTVDSEHSQLVVKSAGFVSCIDREMISRWGSGEGGIRTHGRFKATHALQACLLDHSSTSPIVTTAERVGFEPTSRYNREPLFESGTINHSDTSPRLQFYLKIPFRDKFM